MPQSNSAYDPGEETQINTICRPTEEHLRTAPGPPGEEEENLEADPSGSRGFAGSTRGQVLSLDLVMAVPTIQM